MKSLLILPFLLLGCSGGLSRVWDVQDEELREPAKQAMNDWCEKTDGRYCPIIRGDGLRLGFTLPQHPQGYCGGIRRNAKELHEIFITSDDEILKGCPYFIEDPNATNPVAAEIPGIWRAATRAEALRATISHELGHAADLPDIDDPQSIMLGRGIEWGGKVTEKDATLVD